MKTMASCALLTLFAAAPAAAGVSAVWAVSDGDKVARDARRHPLAGRNAVWDGTTVRPCAARNEIVAFQVIVEADGSGIRALSAALPELRRRGGSERIAYAPPAADPTLYAGRPIQLFSVRDMNVTQETHASWAWAPGSPAAPRRTTGWQPVQLVPENARAGRGGFPVAVGPGLVQAFWIEVYVGRDLPAGVYGGTVTLTADGEKRPLPVELRVFGFVLPDANSLPAMVYFEPGQPELCQGRNLDPAYHRFAHRHRIELVLAYDEARVLAHRGRFDGSDFTAKAGYEGPGEGVGNTIVPVSFYGTGPDFERREVGLVGQVQEGQGLRQGPRHELHPRVGALPGGRPQGPTPVIDAPATEARAIAWASFKHDLDLYFFWQGVQWEHNRQKQGERKQNVWANPTTFDNRGQPRKPVEDQGFINGDGVLMYPGEEVLHPEEDRGIEGPVSTVQLANLRRGLQDHLYLTLARQAGLEALVRDVLQAVVPRVYSDAGETVGFAETGETYEAARLKLAPAIESRLAGEKQ